MTARHQRTGHPCPGFGFTCCSLEKPTGTQGLLRELGRVVWLRSTGFRPILLLADWQGMPMEFQCCADLRGRNELWGFEVLRRGHEEVQVLTKPCLPSWLTRCLAERAALEAQAGAQCADTSSLRCRPGRTPAAERAMAGLRGKSSDPFSVDRTAFSFLQCLLIQEYLMFSSF